VNYDIRLEPPKRIGDGGEVKRICEQRLGAELGYHRAIRRAAGQPGDFVPAGNKRRDEHPSNNTAGARHNYAHSAAFQTEPRLGRTAF
jgi:hypothetical protein